MRRGSLRLQWRYLGEVRPYQMANLAASASGEVRKVTVREGDRVKKGQLLVDIDGRLARARLEAISATTRQADEEQAQALRDLERYRRAGPQVVARAEIERAASQAETLAARQAGVGAQLDEARSQLRLHRVVAPFEGVIAARTIDPGDWVDPGTSMLRLVDNRQVDILVNVAPELARQLRSGMKARLERGAQQGEARIVALVPALETSTRTIKVRLEPETLSEWLLPGTTLDVVFDLERAQEGLIVPRDAIVEDEAGTHVVRLEGDRSLIVPVTLLERNDEAVLVQGALEEGQRVVVRGNERLKAGQKVQQKTSGR